MIEVIDRPDYDLLTAQIKSLAEEDSHYIPVMANASSILYHALPDINWSGFYIVRDGALVLGPFHGKPACIRIEKGSGVCGTCWAEDKVQRVEDVHQFPGHIACDSASNSEIVIPIHRSVSDECEAGGNIIANTGSGRNKEVIAVLDIDSPALNRFTEDDEKGLKAFAAAIENAITGL